MTFRACALSRSTLVSLCVSCGAVVEPLAARSWTVTPEVNSLFTERGSHHANLLQNAGAARPWLRQDKGVTTSIGIRPSVAHADAPQSIAQIVALSEHGCHLVNMNTRPRMCKH